MNTPKNIAPNRLGSTIYLTGDKWPSGYSPDVICRLAPSSRSNAGGERTEARASFGPAEHRAPISRKNAFWYECVPRQAMRQKISPLWVGGQFFSRCPNAERACTMTHLKWSFFYEKIPLGGCAACAGCSGNFYKPGVKPPLPQSDGRPTKTVRLHETTSRRA